MSSTHSARNRFSEPRLVSALAAVLLTAIAAGCSSPPPSVLGSPGTSVPPPPQLVVRSGEHISTLTILDETGLVTGFADGAPVEAVRAISDVAVANVPGRASALGVAWVALPCETNPTLVIFANRGRLQMILDRGPRVPAECDSLGVIYGITLELFEPVAAQIVDIEALSRNPG